MLPAASRQWGDETGGDLLKHKAAVEGRIKCTRHEYKHSQATQNELPKKPSATTKKLRTSSGCTKNTGSWLCPGASGSVGPRPANRLRPGSEPARDIAALRWGLALLGGVATRFSRFVYFGPRPRP